MDPNPLDMPWTLLRTNQVQKVIEIDRMVVTYVERAGGSSLSP